MYIKRIKIKNFKNLNHEIDISPSMNIVVGNNGIGKTNLLEAIFFLGRGESFRHKSDANILGWNNNELFLKVEALVYDDLTVQEDNYTYIVSDDMGLIHKSFKINGQIISKSRYLNKLPVILFIPEDLDLINGGPESRRREIDNFITLVDPVFNEIKKEYKKILINRNRLIKTIQIDKSSINELKFWDDGLIELGSKIIFQRVTTLNSFLPYIQKTGTKIFRENFDELKYIYISKIFVNDIDEKVIKEKFRQKIMSGKDKEIYAGQTLYGPQRDDLKFFSGDIDLHEFGSRGQKRIVALLFKIAMWFYIKENYNKKAILLLDDLMSEIDQDHRSKLQKTLADLDTQIFFTGTQKEDFIEEILNSALHIDI